MSPCCLAYVMAVPSVCVCDITKHDIMNKFMELSVALLELKKQIDKVESDDEVVNDLNTKTSKFKI